jgi:hypothetical protein
VTRGWRPVPTASALRDCEDLAQAPWAGALVALDEALDELPQTRATASVVISNQFVRYIQVPWTEGIYGAADRRALAISCLRAVFGEVVDSWRVVIDAPRFGRAALAAAVDEGLVASLRETLARRRLRLASLQPHLATSLRRWSRHLHSGDGGFVVVEPGCVTALFRRDKAWIEVANRRYRCDSDGESARMVAQQCIEADSLQGGQGAVVLVSQCEASGGLMAGGRPVRPLGEGAGPWPADPWRTLAWGAA